MQENNDSLTIEFAFRVSESFGNYRIDFSSRLCQFLEVLL